MVKNIYGPTKPDLWDEQLDLEASIVDEGMAAFFRQRDKARQRGDGASMGGAHSLMRGLIHPVSVAIRQFMEEAGAAKRGRKHRAVIAKGLDPDVLAYLALKVTLGIVIQQRAASMVLIARRIGFYVERELMFQKFEAEQPELYARILSRLNSQTQHEAHRRRVMIHSVNRNGVEWTQWTTVDGFHVGSKLFDLMNDTLGLFSLLRNRKDALSVCLTAEAMNRIEEMDAERSLGRPKFMPTIIPPKPWQVGGRSHGGYYTDLGMGDRPLRMIKGVGGSNAQAVVDGVNAVQSTGWQVNPDILEAMRWLTDETNPDLGVIPTMKHDDLPPKPHDIETNELARKDWRGKAAKVHRGNAIVASRRYQVLVTMSMAERFAKYDAIYYPYQLDFRGRMYCIPPFLNPQGPDYAKALLRFSEGAPIEDDVAMSWLAIHGANTYGVDKVSLQDRVQWVMDHEEEIVASAKDFKVNRFWAEADNPMGFLAFCHEWTELLRVGFGFVSKLPIAMDGSCNGIQHFSAMLRDPVGGAAVNLTPNEKPADIYQAVADRVLERLWDEEPRSPEGSMARKWIDSKLIDRKVTKRPVMVLPYGGTFTSCRDYVHQAIGEKIADGAAMPFPSDEMFMANNYLAKVVWESISDVVVAAREAMSWLQKCASVCGKAGLKHITWETPSGFRVFQRYNASNMKRLTTVLHGSIVKVNFDVAGDEPIKKPDRRKATQAIAPNFVHSMDAAAMIKTIQLAKFNGLGQFAMVHDSYGTTAAHTSKLAGCVRQSFMDMYMDRDVLDDFREAILAQVPEKFHKDVPALPIKGTLDLSQVMESDFFFA